MPCESPEIGERRRATSGHVHRHVPHVQRDVPHGHVAQAACTIRGALRRVQHDRCAHGARADRAQAEMVSPSELH